MINLAKLLKTENITVKQVSFSNCTFSTNAYFKLYLYSKFFQIIFIVFIQQSLHVWNWVSWVSSVLAVETWN